MSLKKIDERVKLAYQLRTLIGADKRLFYEKIWLWPAPLAPSQNGFTNYGSLFVDNPLDVYTIVGLRGHIGYVWDKRLQNVMRLGKQIMDVLDSYVYVCCICEYQPFHIGDDVFHIHQDYEICRDCYEKVKDIPDFF